MTEWPFLIFINFPKIVLTCLDPDPPSFLTTLASFVRFASRHLSVVVWFGRCWSSLIDLEVPLAMRCCISFCHDVCQLFYGVRSLNIGTHHGHQALYAVSFMMKTRRFECFLHSSTYHTSSFWLRQTESWNSSLFIGRGQPWIPFHRRPGKCSGYPENLITEANGMNTHDSGMSCSPSLGTNCELYTSTIFCGYLLDIAALDHLKIGCVKRC